MSEHGESVRLNRPLVYVAGPYSGPTLAVVASHIATAQRVGVEVRRLGADPYVPHAMSHGVEETQSESEWLAEGLRWLERCKAVVLCPGWEMSHGTRGEIERARELGIPVFETIDQLAEWLRG